MSSGASLHIHADMIAYYKQRRMPRGRYFYSQKQLREYRWLETLMLARAKRAGKKLGSYGGYACSCGCGPFPSELPKELSPLPLPPAPQPKKPTIRSKKTHSMFRGNIL